MVRSARVVGSLLMALVLGAGPASSLTAEQEAELVSPEGTVGDLFGFSVALSGRRVIVGASFADGSTNSTGAAYVFFNHPSVSWIFHVELWAAGGTPTDRFGDAGDLDGRVAVIGATEDDDAGEYAGSAWAFVRSGPDWIQTKLLPADVTAGDFFGRAVAVSGDTAVVGCVSDDDNGEDSGSAYVFVLAAGVWSQQAKLLAGDGEADDFFGRAVDIDGDTIIVGAIGDDDEGTNAGAVYVFTRNAGVWTERAKLLAGDGNSFDGLGETAALDGDTVLAGAPSDDPNGNLSGSAYVFVGSGDAWSQQAKLLPTDGAALDRFGNAVAVLGDTALVGSYQDDDHGENSGSAYLFTRTASDWSEQLKVLPEFGSAEDRFGWSVSLDGDRAVIGAPYSNAGGVVYVFRLVSDPEVPASGGLGLMLLVLALLGGGLLYSRRKAGTVVRRMDLHSR